MGRHSKPREPFVIAITLSAPVVLAVAIGLTFSVGSWNVVTLSSQFPTATSAVPVERARELPALPFGEPLGGPYLSDPRTEREAQRRSESSTRSPVTTSTTAPLPITSPKDQQAPTASSEPPPPPAQPTQKPLPAPPPHTHPPKATPTPVPKAEVRHTNNRCRNIDNLRLKPHARAATQDILLATGHVGALGGLAQRPNNPTSDHPRALATDFGTAIGGNSMGNKIARYARNNESRLAVKYVLWQVKDHYDHVHISFKDNPGPNFNPNC